MSYSRRRVSLACTFCRHRKRRCDARKPQCGNCREAEAECRYDDAHTQRFEQPGSKTDILDKLQGIENLLQNHTQSIAALSAELQSMSGHSERTARSPISHPSVRSAENASSPALSRMDVPSSTWFYNGITFQSDEASLPPLTIPAKHITSSNYLLCLPEMKKLIGEYPTNLFFLLESKNPMPIEFSFDGWHAPHSHVRMDRDVTDYLVSVFFTEVHPCHPVLDRDLFNSIYAKFLETGVDSSVESALCLVVFALGAVAIGSENLQDFAENWPGMKYMQAALPVLISLSAWSFEWHIFLPQALVLASIYFAYIARPLQSWRLVYSASTILQFKLSRLKAQEPDSASQESLLRLFWSCFLVECDRLAELELPQSGLQQITDEISLPSCNNLDESISTCYLAEISIRRLLNRIHNTLYPQKPSVLALSSTSLTTSDNFSFREISSVRAICDELHHQLDIWYDSIPEPFRPSLGVETVANDRERVLRIRYYATKHIIYRPFVLHVIANGALQPSDAVLEKCNICLESCRLYLYNTAHILRRPSQYTWTFSLSSLGAILVLTLASLNPRLKHLVLDIHELQTSVIDNIKRWALPGSSLEAVTSIIQDLQRKQRILSCV